MYVEDNARTKEGKVLRPASRPGHSATYHVGAEGQGRLGEPAGLALRARDLLIRDNLLADPRITTDHLVYIYTGPVPVIS